MKLRFWAKGAPPSRKSDIADWPWSAEPPSWLLGSMVGVERAVGLPAVLGVFRLLAGATMLIPLITYRGEQPNRERARDAYQYRLLRRKPNADAGTTAAAFRADIVVSLLGRGNAYVRKFKARDRVKELVLLPASKVKPVRRGGVVVFEDWSEGGSHPVMRGPDEVIHIRTFALDGKLEGVSPITAAREAIVTALKRGRFEGAYYDNDLRPGIAIGFPEKVTKEQAEKWLELLEAQHGGIENKHRPWIAGGGATITPIPISLRDALFVEAMQLSTQEIGAMYQIPKSFLNATEGDQPVSETDRMNLGVFALGPALTAIDEALSADTDLFPDGSDLMCEHLMDALLQPDTVNRYRAYKDARQGSWITANEIRARENMPPIEGGDEIQITPVGGAPNPKGAAITVLSALAGRQLQEDELAELLEHVFAGNGNGH